MAAAVTGEVSIHQTTYRLLTETLEDALRAWVLGGPVNGGSFFRSTAALYSLLLAHPLNRHGRCRSCRTFGGRPCRVYTAARFYLHQPEKAVWLQIADELGHPDASTTDPTSTQPKIDYGRFNRR